MALQINDTTAIIGSTTNLVPASANYTAMVWVKSSFVATSPAYIAHFALTNAGYTAWAGIFSDAALSDGAAEVNVSDGGAPVNTTNQILQANRAYHLTYKRSGNTHSFYVDCVFIGSVTKNISGVTFAELLLGNDRFSAVSSAIQFREWREWDASLGITAMVAEMQSRSAVRTADLHRDCPLVNDLNDDSGNDFHLSGSGAYQFVSDVAPPVNADGNAATELTASGIVELVVDDDWRSWWVYFKYKNKTDADQVISLAHWGTVDVAEVPFDGVYRPYANIYHGEAPILNTDILPDRVVGQMFKNGSTTIPIPAGITYQIQVRVGGVTDGGGNSPNATLRLKFVLGPNAVGAESGLVLIRAASFSGVDADGAAAIGLKGLHAALINPATNTIAGFIPQFPTGESGDIQRAAKRYVFADESKSWEASPGSGKYYIYQTDENFQILPNKIVWESSIAPPAKNRTHLPTEKVYFTGGLIGGGGTNYSYMTAAGTQGPVGNIPHAALASGFISAIAVDNAEGIMYVAVPVGGSSEQRKIKKWNLITPGFGADLAAAVADHYVTDMLVIEDDTILALYYKSSAPKALFIRQLNSSGTVLQTITPTLAGTLGSTAPRLGYSATPGAFMLLNHYDDARNHSRKIKISDGSVLAFAITPNVLQSDEEIEDPPLPSSSDSCPIIEAGPTSLILPVDCVCCCPEPSPGKVPPTVPTTWNPGAVLDPVDPGEWDEMCTGPGDVPTAADPTDSEIWVS